MLGRFTTAKLVDPATLGKVWSVVLSLVIPARRFSTAEGLVKQESSAFAFNSLKALDPSFRWDDEQNQTFLRP